MATLIASAKFTNAFRVQVVDKTISAALTSSFSLGNQNQPNPTLVNEIPTVFANVLINRRRSIVSDLESTSSLTNTMRYSTKSGGNVTTDGYLVTGQSYVVYQVGNSDWNTIAGTTGVNYQTGSEFIANNNGVIGSTGKASLASWSAKSSLVCEFPTYLEIDIEALMLRGLPEGTDCVLNFEEGWQLEDRGRLLPSGVYEYNSNTQDSPSPEFPSFVTFRTPKFLNSRLNSVFSLPTRTAMRIKQLQSAVASASTLSAIGIYNPGKFAALFAGVSQAVTVARKTVVTGATLFNIFGPFGPIAINTRIRQGDSAFSSLFTMPAIDNWYRRLGVSIMSSTATISATVIRNIGPNIANITSTSLVSATGVKTKELVQNISSVSTLTANALRTPGLIQNITAVSSLSVSGSIAMVLEITSNSISLPIMYGSVNCSIDWGDGTSTTLTSTNGIQPQHSYSAPYGTGVTKQIKISGYIQHFGYASTANVPGWNDTNSNTGSLYWAYNSLTRIVSFGDLGTETFISAFSNARSCSGGIPTRLPSTITDISGMFQHTTADDQFQDFSNVSGWNVVNVTKMEKTFYRNRNGFNPNIGSWNVSNVTNMNRMFYFADSAAFNPNLSGWCVTLIPTEPTQFSSLTTAVWPANRRPQWGTCP